MNPGICAEGDPDTDLGIISCEGQFVDNEKNSDSSKNAIKKRCREEIVGIPKFNYEETRKIRIAIWERNPF